jgi:hypothetical protein
MSLPKFPLLPCRLRDADSAQTLIYESWFGQTIEDNSFELDGLRIVNVRKRQKMMKNDRLKTIFLAGNNFGVQHFGRYQEEWIFQIYDTDELGYELKVSDWSTFIVSEIKDFPHLNDPAAQNVGRWITRKVQYDYSGTLEGDVNATAIETHDNPYFNQPNYTLNLGPVTKTTLSFVMGCLGWTFSYDMVSDVPESNSTGTVTANGPSLPLTAGAPAGLWLNWVIGVRGDQPKNAILGYIWSNLNNLPNPESFVEWTIDDLRDDYDHRFDFATESPAIKPFPTLYGE